MIKIYSNNFFLVDQNFFKRKNLYTCHKIYMYMWCIFMSGNIWNYNLASNHKMFFLEISRSYSEEQGIYLFIYYG